MIRMTAQYPFDSQGQAPEDAIFLNRFIRIGRAGRVITAVGRQIRRNNPLVKSNQKKRQVFKNRHSVNLENRIEDSINRPALENKILS
jgi:hypothetical protein